ncbi:MAG: cyclophilin-like fold protein [Clostridia bacterium]|nr:cyclophilin-like fold protein [Clostridia bacterium]
MKRTMMMILVILMMLSVCLTASAESGKRVAKDGAQMQTDDPTMPTRLPLENGTKILLHFGDTVIPGVLNDSETAQALIAKLPYTQHMSRYSHDFCGVTEDLPYNEEEEHYGWLNGDIDYATDAPYFTILFEDQDESEIYGSQVNIGVITCPLADIAALNGSYDVLIELGESEEEEETMMQMKINNTPVTVAWENNESVAALKELAANGLTIQMSMYGGFEQVGSIGQRLPSSDVQTSTSSGDIVLYSSNQLVVFYGSNSWAYTRLGHITDKTPEEMRTLLSNGDVTITLSVQ